MGEIEGAAEAADQRVTVCRALGSGRGRGVRTIGPEPAENYYVKLGRRNRSYIYQIVNWPYLIGKAHLIWAKIGNSTDGGLVDLMPRYIYQASRSWSPVRLQRRWDSGSRLLAQ